MKILALDLGTKMGWAIRRDGLIVSGVKDFSIKRGDSPGLRYSLFAKWLKNEYFINSDLVYYEQPHMRGGYATEVLYAFVGILQKWCNDFSVEHSAVHTARLKWVLTQRSHSVTSRRSVPEALAARRPLRSADRLKPAEDRSSSLSGHVGSL